MGPEQSRRQPFRKYSEKGDLRMGNSRGSWDGQEARGGTRDRAGSHSRDWLVPVLLLFMWDAGSYDSRLQERLGELGLDGTGPEEMYRTLWRMEREGMVVCNRDGSGFKIPRRRYETPGAGLPGVLGGFPGRVPGGDRPVSQDLRRRFRAGDTMTSHVVGLQERRVLVPALSGARRQRRP